MRNKKVIYILLALILCLSINVFMITSDIVVKANDDNEVDSDFEFSADEYRNGDSIVISDIEQMEDFAEYVNSGKNTVGVTFSLDQDLQYNIGSFENGTYIPIEGGEDVKVFTPIGLNYPFKGTFDGNGRRITGLYCGDRTEYLGVFAKTEFATIKNLTIYNAYLDGTNYVGGVVGYAQGTVFENIQIENSYINGEQNFGDIVGLNYNTVEISSLEDLNNLSKYVREGNETSGMTYTLTKDIVVNAQNFDMDSDFSSLETFIPIGSKEYPFKGKFNGNNKKISGLYLDADKIDNFYNFGKVEEEKIDIYTGLFGYTNGASIENLTIENSYSKGEKCIGLVCSFAAQTNMDNLVVKSSYVIGNENVGGIVGVLVNNSSTSIFRNSYFTGLVSARENLGGIAGIARSNLKLNHIEMENLFNYGKVLSTGYVDIYKSLYVGGLFGCVENVVLSNSKNYGEISVSEKLIGPEIIYVGGITGKADNCYIFNCVNNKNVVGLQNVGGIVGISEGNTTIVSCENNGMITGRKQVGGIVGLNRSIIQDSTNNGNITGLSYVGGIAGNNEIEESSVGTIVNCKSYGSLYSKKGVSYEYNNTTLEYEIIDDATDYISQYFGGIVGNNLGLIDNSLFKGSMSLNIETKEAEYVGGLVGYTQNGTIKNSYAEGYLNVYGNYVGGLVGYLDNSSLLNSYSIVDIEKIKALSYGGGLVGYCKVSKTLNCYSMGKVVGDNYMGTLIGTYEDGLDADNNPITCVINNLYYPDYITLKAVNNLDFEGCTALDYEYFKKENENSLVNLLNNQVNIDNGYKQWTYGDEYPIYKVLNAKLYYDLNGGMGIFVDENSYTINEIVELDFNNIPVRENYSFIGYTLNNGETIYDSNSKTIILSKEINILKAVWEENLIEDIVCQANTYKYNPDENYGLVVEGVKEGDIIYYSADGIDYSAQEIKYNLPGEYTIFVKVERNNYFDFYTYGKITILKLDLDFTELAWQREWYITSLQDMRVEKIENNKFTYNSYENNISLIPSKIPYGVSVEYYVNNNKVEYLTCKNAGNYSITAKFIYDKNIYNENIESLVFNLEIEKIRVNKPRVQGQTSFEFINAPINVQITNDIEADKSTYKIENDTNTLVGDYVAVCSLIDTLNFVWVDGTINDVVFNYSITPKLIEIPTVNYDSFMYDGKPHKLTFDKFSDVLVVLNNNEQTKVGEYQVVVYLSDNKNYAFVDTNETNITYKMEITPMLVSKPTINKTIFNYDGKQKSLNIVSTDNYVVLNQTALVAGEYQAIISLKDKVNTVWADTLGVDDFGINYKINKKMVTKPQIDTPFVYNGHEQTFGASTNNYLILNNKRTVVGTQNVIVTLLDKANTCWEDYTYDDLSLEFTVLPAKMTIITGDRIQSSLVEDVVTTNLSQLILQGAKIQYSLSKNGEYVDALEIEQDGNYVVYYKVMLENYEDLLGSFKITRETASNDKVNLGAILLYTLLFVVVIGGISFVIVCYIKKILIFKPASLEMEKVDKKLPFEIHNTENIENENKSVVKSTNDKLVEHLNEDLNKATEIHAEEQKTRIEKDKKLEDDELDEEVEQNETSANEDNVLDGKEEIKQEVVQEESVNVEQPIVEAKSNMGQEKPKRTKKAPSKAQNNTTKKSSERKPKNQNKMPEQKDFSYIDYDEE